MFFYQPAIQLAVMCEHITLFKTVSKYVFFLVFLFPLMQLYPISTRNYKLESESLFMPKKKFDKKGIFTGTCKAHIPLSQKNCFYYYFY